jgi:selenocysteine lyase/cysteine desulfurase
MSDLDIEALRAITPGCANRNHLNNAGAALLTSVTIAAMTDYLQREALIGGYEAAADGADLISATYESLSELVGALPSQIALFDNSTHAWNAACYSVPLAPGDRILTGRNEYGSAVLAYLQLAQRTGAVIVVVPNDESGQIDVDALAGLIDERTKLIGLTWVPTAGGLVNPAAAVGRIARAADVLYLLDATQVVGQFPIDVNAIGCDMLTGTGRKFLRGPRGTGFLYVGARALDRLDPYVAEIRSATWVGGDVPSRGPTERSASRRGRTATSTSSGSAPRCARRLTSASTRSGDAALPSAPDCALASPGLTA